MRRELGADIDAACGQLRLGQSAPGKDREICRHRKQSEKTIESVRALVYNNDNNKRTEDTNMVKLLVGHKGTGKTKQMIDLANEQVEHSNGSIYFHQQKFQIDV